MTFIHCFISRGFFCCLCSCAFGVVYDVTEVAPNSSKEEEKLQGRTSDQLSGDWSDVNLPLSKKFIRHCLG
jgi:hypothetical protein